MRIRFVSGSELNSEIERIMKEAQKQLIVISPYIKLHGRTKDALIGHKNRDSLQMSVVFGKNEQDLAKSMSIEDAKFFTEFPNVEIHYKKNLHAKVYANDSAVVVTSMNLHEHSQNENIEAGILIEKSGMINVGFRSLLYGEIHSFIKELLDKSQLIYHKSPPRYKRKYGLLKEKLSTEIFDKIDENYGKSVKNRNIVEQKVSKCPCCGGKIIEEKYQFICEKNKELKNCGFYMYKDVLNKNGLKFEDLLFELNENGCCVVSKNRQFVVNKEERKLESKHIK